MRKEGGFGVNYSSGFKEAKENSEGCRQNYSEVSHGKEKALAQNAQILCKNGS